MPVRESSVVRRGSEDAQRDHSAHDESGSQQPQSMRFVNVVLPFLLVITGSPGLVTRSGTLPDSCQAEKPMSAPPQVLVRRAPSGNAARRADSVGSLSLDLNIPAHRLDAYEHGVRIARYTVAVGMPRYRTPRGEYRITSVEWNPWWIPPDSPWAENERPTPPGPSNPMGRVKLNFLPYYFLHGTPAVQSLGQSASHGCVRMSNADVIELALRVHAAGTPTLERDLLDSLISDASSTKLIQLDLHVPIRIRYDVAEVIDDTLFVYADTYSLDRRSEMQRALGALAAAGIDSLRIQLEQLRNGVRSTSKRPVRLAVSNLMAPVAPDTASRRDRHPAGTDVAISERLARGDESASAAARADGSPIVHSRRGHR